MAREPLREGDPARVGGYRLTARLGAGGMGVVYLGEAEDGAGNNAANSAGNSGQVAVKVLRPELADDAEFRKRFGREVTTLLRVKGACTVRVLQADTESPRPFLVTEYADGPSLAEYVEANGPLDAQMLYGLATGLAEALTAIHAAGVVHRDLKPSNVLLTDAGPKVIDFGIAQAMDATAVTKTGMTVGSAGFMAPEQVMGRAAPASDIFAWAVTVGYAASGQPPFGTGASDAILYRILHAEPDIAAVPAALRPQVEAALAKDPERRPTASGLLGELTGTAAPPDNGEDTTPTQAVLAQTWHPTTTGTPALVPGARRGAGPAARRPRRPLRRVPVLLTMSAAALVVGAGVATALTMPARTSAAHTAALHDIASRAPAATPSPSSSPSPSSTPSPSSSPSPSSTPSPSSSPSPSYSPSPPSATVTPAPTVTATPPLPVLTAGSYTGREPSTVYFSGDAGNVVTGLSWVNWTPTGATGDGESYIDNCIPDCAGGKMTKVLTEIVLTNPIDGRFTTITETRNHTTESFYYPAAWPWGAK